MIKKIKSFIQNKISFKKKCKKIDQYRKNKKIDENKKYKKIEKKIKRNKYNVQLNFNFKVKNYLNIILFSIIIILSILLLIVRWDYFKIKNIHIISPDWISNTYLLEKKLNYLLNNLIFKIDKSEIKNNILDIEQNIIKIDISKKFPDTLKIKVFSSDIIFSTTLKWKDYLITENWVLIPANSNKSDNIKIILNNFELENYPDYKKILNTKNLKKILFLKDKLIDNITNLKIEKIIYYKTEKEVHFIINNNSRLIFDLIWDTNKQLKQIFVFNKEKINITKPGIIYIDNRISGKILFCPLKEINKCIKNINFIYWDKLKISDYKKVEK